MVIDMGWKRLIQKGDIVFGKLAVALPCCWLINESEICGADTHYAVIVPHADHDTIFPVCKKHAPDWAKGVIKDDER